MPPPGLYLPKVFPPAREPQTPEEWLAYYDLRWRVLRSPWHQPKGSEKDELEDHAVHRMIFDDNHVIAIGRLHFLDDATAQIRYMAVNPDYEKQGLGKQILHSLEQAAKQQPINKILLHAREDATGFYEKQGYTCIKPSHTLYDEIKHFLMEKKIEN